MAADAPQGPVTGSFLAGAAAVIAALAAGVKWLWPLVRNGRSANGTADGEFRGETKAVLRMLVDEQREQVKALREISESFARSTDLLKGLVEDQREHMRLSQDYFREGRQAIAVVLKQHGSKP